MGKEIANRLKKVSGITWAAILIFIVFSFTTKGFISEYSISTIFKNASILVVVAFGMTSAIILGKIDVSVGANMSLCSVIVAYAINANIPLPVAILIGICVGMLIGLFNGICIAVFKFNFWLVTFATLGIVKGIALGLTNGTTISKLGDNFEKLGNGTIGGVYYITIIAVIIGVIVWFITKKTRYGYNLYAVGNNSSVAALSGINVTKVTIQTYVLSGALASIAGILLASKSNAANPIIGDPYSFDTIAATIIGGTPFVGGKGGVIGTLFGAFLLVSLKHGLALMGFSSLYQIAIIGGFIMIIIIADVVKENRKERKEKRRVFND